MYPASAPELLLTRHANQDQLSNLKRFPRPDLSDSLPDALKQHLIEIAEREPSLPVRAKAFLRLLAALGLNLAPADVYSDDDGDVRIVWHMKPRTVELVFPADGSQPDYLYRSDATDYGLLNSPSPQAAYAWISWTNEPVLEVRKA